MAQQIINIPINWDDDLITSCIEKGVVNEVKEEIKKKAMRELSYGSYSHGVFTDTLKDCVTEVVQENKEKILEEVIKKAHRSLISSKLYKERVKEMLDDIEDCKA